MLTPSSVEAAAGLDKLVARFLTCTLPHDEWTHAAHLAVGLWHVDRYSVAEALVRLRDGIRRLNDSHGTVNSGSSGYHETITAAYVMLLAEFNTRFPADRPLAERVDSLMQSTLARKDALLAFYAVTTLMSEEARARWVEPDLAPLDPGRTDEYICSSKS